MPCNYQAKTHFCNTTSTLIDNIFISKHDHDYNAGLLITDLSDHLPIFYISPNRIHDKKFKKVYKPIRDLSDHAIQKLHDKLLTVDWNVLDNINDVNVRYDTFVQIFESAYNECLPVKVVKVQLQNNSHKPWITKGIKKSIKKRDKLYKSWIVSRTEDAKAKHRSYRNRLTYYTLF